MEKMIRAKKVRCSILRLPQNDDEDFEDFPDADLNFDDNFNITYAKEMGSNFLKLYCGCEKQIAEPDKKPLFSSAAQMKNA